MLFVSYLLFLWYKSLYFLFDKSIIGIFVIFSCWLTAFPLDVEIAYAEAIEDVEQKLREPQAAYIIESQNNPSIDSPQSVIVHGQDLPFELPNNAFLIESDQESHIKSLRCSYFCVKSKDITSFSSVEEVISLFFIFCCYWLWSWTSDTSQYFGSSPHLLCCSGCR